MLSETQSLIMTRVADFFLLVISRFTIMYLLQFFGRFCTIRFAQYICASYAIKCLLTCNRKSSTQKRNSKIIIIAIIADCDRVIGYKKPSFDSNKGTIQQS